MQSYNRQLTIKNELAKLQAIAPDIEGAAVITLDGLMLASTLPSDADEDRTAAMGASMLSLAEMYSLELSRGSMEQVFIRGTDGDVLMMSVGEHAVLTVISRREAKLGMLIYYMRRTVKELMTVF